tara:strand:- start:1638 stop:2420 length:783 start_codon:yes stop_codon:yes gene_type:complete
MTIAARTEGLREGLPGHGGQIVSAKGVGQSIYAESSTPKHKLGSRLQLGPRVFYYALAGEALTAAKMVAFTADKDLETTVTVAHGIGTTALTVTAESTITVDQYAEGMLIVDQGTGAGDQYVIKNNAAIGSSATGTVTIYEPGLVTAWATSDTDIALWTNPFYKLTQVGAATASGAGIPLIDVTDAYYFWVQTYGPAGVLIKTAATSGTAAAEQAMHIDTAGDLTAAIAGDTIDAISILAADDTVEEDADFGCVYLTCVA